MADSHYVGIVLAIAGTFMSLQVVQFVHHFTTIKLLREILSRLPQSDGEES